MGYSSDVIAVTTPGVRMASWAFILGLLGFLAVVISPALSGMAWLMPFVLFGGLAVAVVAVVLGLVGLGSVNRASAFAGLLLGLLALTAYFFFVRGMV